jgi:hypothetical protein
MPIRAATHLAAPGKLGHYPLFRGLLRARSRGAARRGGGRGHSTGSEGAAGIAARDVAGCESHRPGAGWSMDPSRQDCAKGRRRGRPAHTHRRQIFSERDAACCLKSAVAGQRVTGLVVQPCDRLPETTPNWLVTEHRFGWPRQPTTVQPTDTTRGHSDPRRTRRRPLASPWRPGLDQIKFGPDGFGCGHRALTRLVGQKILSGWL